MALSPDRRERAEDIFFDFLEEDGEADREEILAKAGGDVEVTDEVMKLLASHQEASEMLPDTPVAPPMAQVEIGPYRIIGELGRGGMGRVHLAERIGDYSMQVAIKVLPPGLAGTVARERFVAERRILAKLEHPGIARLLDGGWTADGRPYIVMERVDGVPISRYTATLDVNDRLALFQQVAEAVQYAHRHLIVHRDLKPSNILVSTEGRVKLLDFGIAKLLDEDDATEALTRTGERMLTPDYASPEQIRGEAVTTASDVYQLGVVLYEMLTGVLPLKLGGRSLVEAERTVSDTVPKVPSVRLDEIERAETGEVTRRRTARMLRGDLDNIIMKALRKEPENRYPSPEAMADDVRRYLEGRPVEARGTTTLYLVRKFVQRHRGVVVAASLLFLSLVAFSIVSYRQAHVIGIERDRVARERDNARRVVSFMVELFEQAKPENDPERDITVRDVLNAGAVRIESDLQETPEARASFMNVIGSAYGIIGDRDQGERLLRQALDIRTGLDSLGLDAAETMNDLGVVQLRARRFDEADSLLSRALAIRLEKDAMPTEIASTQLNLAIVRERQRRFDEAEQLYSEALPVFRDGFGLAHRYWAVATNNLAMLKRSQGARQEAEALLRELLPEQRSSASGTDASLALTLTNLGTIVYERQGFDEAEGLHREAVSLFEGIDGARPREVSARQNLAAALSAQGKFDEAEREFLSALQSREAMFGPDNFQVATVLNNLGSMWQRAGRAERAEPRFRRAVQIARGTPRLAVASRSQIEVNWGWSLLRSGRPAEASTAFLGIEAAGRDGEAVPARLLFDAEWGLAIGRMAVGKSREAIANYREAERLAADVLPPRDPRWWRLRVELAEALHAAGQIDQAYVLAQQSVDSLTAMAPPETEYLARGRAVLAGAPTGLPDVQVN